MSNGNKIACYSFLPWLRQGIANNIGEGGENGVASGPQRARISLDLEISTDTGATTVVPDNIVELVGPGDIIGISNRAIIRTEPLNWITDFEPNYFPLIEFYDEDFPWRYTPLLAAGHRLRPWIALVSLKETEFEESEAIDGPLPFITTTKPPIEVFPNHRQLWFWTHVHVNSRLPKEDFGTPGTVSELEKLLDQDPDLGCSRIMCPRKLDPETAYHAFLIPTFETGRLAGLGESDPEVGLSDSAWSDSNPDWRFPYYHRWYFRTGTRGDFEYLVRLLKPRPVDQRVGIRPMDVQNPDSGIDGITNPPVLGLEGALKSPTTESTDWPQPYPDQFQQDLVDRIKLAEDYQQAEPDSDPIITPPLYGRWHALKQRLQIEADATNPDNPYNPDGKWVHELNLDPRHRVAAGFGTRVVRKHQETYMNEAWKQVGDVLEANRRLRLAQLAKEASCKLYDKHLIRLNANQVLQVTAPLQGKVRVDNQTVFKLVHDSTLPQAVLSPALRKIIRSRGPINIRVRPDTNRQPDDLITRISEGEITATPPKQAPTENIALDEASTDLDLEDLPPWLQEIWRNNPVTEDSLTESSVDELPNSPDFRITEPDEEINFRRGDSDSVEAGRFKQALGDLYSVFDAEPPQKPPRLTLNVESTATTVVTAIDPLVTIPFRILNSISFPPLIRQRLAERIRPVMAYPELPYPMYEPLRDISTELLIPNINLIQQNTISLLITNQKFIESYMVGLNHEMGRELLWREYPTDQRGSYFRQFWDVKEYVNTDDSLSEEELAEKLKDIKPIHTWLNSSELGSHNNRDAEGDETQLVLLIRGELLKKYPNAVIYAHRAEWELKDDGSIDVSKPRKLTDNDTEEKEKLNEKYPLYKAKVEPDIDFLGFDLTVEEAKGGTGENPTDDPGWFFVIKERPGEPRFGLDINQNPAGLDSWDDLSWEDVNFVDTSPENKHILINNVIKLNPPLPGEDNNPENVTWDPSTNAADLAHITYQDPVLIAVHASEMLESL